MNALAAAPAAEAKSRFVVSDDGTVTDTTTGLMWSKATLNDDEVDHASAERICADLGLAGYADWRLPTVEELFSLADRSRHSPAIDSDAFPDTKSDWYWTSTICAWSSAHAWFVYFSLGGAYSVVPRGSSNGFVRAVRVASPGQ